MGETRTTRIESITRQFFDEIYPSYEHIYNHRPDWLKNEKTGKNLEIDIFYPTLLLGIEVNGIFHTLESIKERDDFKKKKFGEMGITYLEIRDMHDLWRFRKKHCEGVRLSKSLYEDMKEYKPNKKAFSQKFGFAKKKEKRNIRNKEIFEIWKKERESNLRRMKLKQENKSSKPVHNSLPSQLTK